MELYLNFMNCYLTRLNEVSSNSASYAVDFFDPPSFDSQIDFAA